MTAPGCGGADEIREQLAAALPESLGPVGLRRPAIPALDVQVSVTGYGVALLDALLPTVQALIAEAEERGLQSVGLGDFLPDPCGDEKRAPNWHFVESYGEWLPCSRRSGHDGDHEHEESGFTWPRAEALADEMDGPP